MRSRVELRKVLTAATFLLTLSVLACENKETGGFKPEIQPLPAGLARYEAMEIPADNPMTPEKAALGRQLFFDKRLSGDGSRSCYFCHVCEHGLTDGQAKATGAFNKPLPRSSPTLWNIGYHKMFYWDGRSPSLEKQAMAAWQLGNMGAKDHEAEILATINGLQGYRSQFHRGKHNAGHLCFRAHNHQWRHCLGPLAGWRPVSRIRSREAWMGSLQGSKVQQLPRRGAIDRSAIPQRRDRDGCAGA